MWVIVEAADSDGGADTASRRWIKYEINEIVWLGKGVFGVHIYRIKDQNEAESTQGTNPFQMGVRCTSGQGQGQGRGNLGKWVDAAFRAAFRRSRQARSAGCTVQRAHIDDHETDARSPRSLVGGRRTS